MKVKNVRNAKNTLAIVLALELWLIESFNILPSKELELSIGKNETDSYVQGFQESPYLIKEEYEMEEALEYNREKEYSRNLTKKNSYTNNYYRRNARNSLEKPNYYYDRKDF